MDKLVLFVKKFILFLLLVPIVVIAFYAVLTMPAGVGNINNYVDNAKLIIASISFSLFIFTIWFGIKINKLPIDNYKYGYLILGGILLFIQIVLIVNLDINQTTDAYMIIDQAKAIASGMEVDVDPANIYFQIYSNNNFALVLLVAFYKILNILKISTNTNIPLQILAAFCLDISIFLSVFVVTKSKGKSKGLIFLTYNILNPFNYILIFWSYTMVYSLPIMIGIPTVYYCLKKGKSSIVKKIVCLLLIGLLSVMGYFMRPTAVIPLIAIIIYELLDIIKKPSRKTLKKALASAFILALAIFISYSGINKYMSKYLFSSERNFPIHHWIMIGLNEDGCLRAEDINFTNSFTSTEEMKEANIEVINNRLSESSVSDMLNLAVTKWKITWSEGTGSYNNRINYAKTENFFYDWFIGNRSDFLLLYCQAYRILVIFLAIMSIFMLFKKMDDWTWIASLVLLGGIIFYTVWEAKSIYCVPFIPFLLALSLETSGNIKNFCPPVLYKKRFVIILLLALVFLCGSFLSIKEIYTKDNHTFRHYAIHTEDNRFWLYRGTISNLSTTGGKFSQYFIVDEDFDTIRIQCESFSLYNNAPAYKDRTHYFVQVFNEENECLLNQEVKEKDIADNYLTLQLPDQINSERTEYRVEILSDCSGQDWIYWSYLKSKASSQYDGRAYLGKEPFPDINMSVYKEYDTVYMSEFIYDIVLVIFMFLGLFIIFDFLKMRAVSKCRGIEKKSGEQ